MKTIKDIFTMYRVYWCFDSTCVTTVSCEHCKKGGICNMQLFAMYDLLKDGEYH